MNYLKISENQEVTYPYALWRVQQDFPNTSFVQPFESNDLSPFGVFPVIDTPKPGHDPITQQVAEVLPELVSGVWEQRWLVATLSAEQAAQNLLAAKIAKNTQINAWRLQANRGVFTHSGKSFSCDELSRSDIDGITSFVTLAGSLPPGWPGGWKAVDNTYLPISTVADWANFVASMVSAGNANFAAAQAMKAQLVAATTQAAIDAIVW